MSLTFGAGGDAQVATGVYGAAWLIELDFSGGMLYVTTAPVDVVSGGHTYTGLGNLASVGTVGESEDASAEQITLGMSIVNTAMLAAVLGGASTYRGRSAVLRLQLFTEAFIPVGSAVKRWSGTMEPARITRSRAGDGGAPIGRIEIPCTRAGMARVRNHQGLRHTHAQQQQRYPGDLGLQYMQDLIEKPALWLSKRFQEI